MHELTRVVLRGNVLPRTHKTWLLRYKNSYRFSIISFLWSWQYLQELGSDWFIFRLPKKSSLTPSWNKPKTSWPRVHFGATFQFHRSAPKYAIEETALWGDQKYLDLFKCSTEFREMDVVLLPRIFHTSHLLSFLLWCAYNIEVVFRLVVPCLETHGPCLLRLKTFL